MDKKRTALLIETMLWVCAATVVASCSSVNLSPNMKPETGSPYGVVFGAIGTTGDDADCVMRALQYRVVGEEPGGKNRGQFIHVTGAAGLSSLIGLAYLTPTDFTDGASKGTVFVARLKPGKYEIYMALFSKAPLGGFASRSYANEFSPIRFEVKPGKAIYLGEFLSRQRLVRDSDGVPTDAGGYFVVRDQLTRDREMLPAKGVDAETPIINLAASFSASPVLVFQPVEVQ